MRSVALVALLMLIAAPVFAADGNVSASTLNSLGLGGMQTVSDAQGMQVRGAQLLGVVKGTSLIFGQLLTPDTKNFVSFSSVNEVDGSADVTSAPLTVTKAHAVGTFIIDPLTGGVALVPVTLNVNVIGTGAFQYVGSISGIVGGAGSITITP